MQMVSQGRPRLLIAQPPARSPRALGQRGLSLCSVPDTSRDTSEPSIHPLADCRLITSGRALRLLPIRQARLEPLALSASGRERMVYGRAAASEEKRIGFFRKDRPVW